MLGIKKCFNSVSHNEFTIFFYSSIDISVYHLLAMYGHKKAHYCYTSTSLKKDLSILLFSSSAGNHRMIVFAFFTFQCEIRLCKKKKKTPPKGATHFIMAHFALQNKTIKDNMKRRNITDQVNVFFSFWKNNDNSRNAVSLQKNITEPFRRFKTQQLVDIKSLHFGIKTVKIDIRSFIITLIRTKAKGSNVYPKTDDLNWP